MGNSYPQYMNGKKFFKQGLDILGAAATRFKIGGTAVTSTAAELNILDGVTATASELNGSSDVSAAYIVVADANYTMLVINSGKPHVIANVSADRTITFPAEASGLTFEFFALVGAADGHDWIFDTGSDTNFFTGGVLSIETTSSPNVAAPIVSDGNSNSKFQVNLPQGGTRVKFVSDGTLWNVTGVVTSSVVPAFADQ